MFDCESDEEDEATDKQLKLVILGDSATGKTSLATQYLQEKFSNTHKPTVGVDFYMKRILMKGRINAVLHIWDLGGNCLGGKMLSNYIYGAHGIMFVYDMTNALSFENLSDWMSVVNACSIQSGSKTLPHLALVANKADQLHLRTVSEERHHNFAKENDMASYFLSAKTGDSVSFCFQNTTAGMLGLRLTTPDQELQQTVVTAHIESDETGGGGGGVQASNSNNSSSQRSPICSIQ